MSIAAGSVADPTAYTDPEAFKTPPPPPKSWIATACRYARSTMPSATSGRQIRVKWTPSGNRVSLRIDITELKRLQQELLRAQRMETIGRISRGVAHDFNGR